MKPEYMWAGIGASVIAYDLLCANGETLSEGVDKALEKHPILTVAAIGVTALHLCNLLPKQVDPYYQALKALK